MAQNRRRSGVAIVTAGAVASAGLLALTAPAAQAATTRYVSCAGSGTLDGSSAANAAAITGVSSQIAAAGAGGVVEVAGGDCSHSGGIAINAGGAAGAPVTVRGVPNAAGQLPNLVGTRQDPYVSASGAHGLNVFVLEDRADHLVFEKLNFKNQGNGVFRFGGSAVVGGPAVVSESVTLRDMYVDNVRRFVENDGTNSPTDLKIQRVEVHGYSKQGVRLRNASANVLIEDSLFDSEAQDGDEFAMGIHLDEQVSNATVRRVTTKNNHQTNTTGYQNGDGVATEPSVVGVLLEDLTTTGNTDGGVDLKSQQTRLVRVVAEDNKRNFRIWGEEKTLTDSTSRNPFKRGGSGSTDHVWISRSVPTVHTLVGFDAQGPGGWSLDTELNGAGEVKDKARLNIDLSRIEGSTPPAGVLSEPLDHTLLNGVLVNPRPDYTTTFRFTLKTVTPAPVGPVGASWSFTTAAPTLTAGSRATGPEAMPGLTGVLGTNGAGEPIYNMKSSATTAAAASANAGAGTGCVLFTYGPTDTTRRWTPKPLTFKLAKGGSSGTRGVVVRTSDNGYSTDIANVTATAVQPTFQTVTANPAPDGERTGDIGVRICPFSSNGYTLDMDDLVLQ